ncbi:MAG: peptidoglycan binding domain-containing protein [Lachnospiraceae bacterium]|nr:peptidoglycan binding domain-containing protein [Lachnospiraceae bacterium]
MAWKKKAKKEKEDSPENDDVMDAQIEPVGEKAENAAASESASTIPGHVDAAPSSPDVADASYESVPSPSDPEDSSSAEDAPYEKIPEEPPVEDASYEKVPNEPSETEPAGAADAPFEKIGDDETDEGASENDEASSEKKKEEAKKLTQKEKLDAKVKANADRIAAKEKIRRDKIEAREKKRTDKILEKERVRSQKIEAREKAKNEKAERKQKAAAEKLAAEAKKRDDRAAEKRRIYEAKKARQEEKAEEKRRKREANRPRRIRNTAIFLIILALVLIGGGIFYTKYAEYFQTHFYAGTKINGQDYSYKSVSEVKAALKNEAEQYSLTIKERDGNVEVLSAKDLGWTYVDNHSVDSLMLNQHAWKWIREYSAPQDVKVKLTSSYDRDTVKAAIAKLSIMTAEPVPPTDATLVAKNDGTYEVQPETEGNQIDEEKLETAIFTALNKEDKTLDIVDGTDCYIHPRVYKDDKTLLARRDALNKYMGLTISYAFGDSTEVIDGSFLRQYITDNGQEVTLATDWIRPLVMSWAQKYDTFSRDIQFTTHSGNVITVPGGGSYGWALNPSEMIDDLTKAIEDAKSGARDPIWLIKGQGFENGGITGSYVEISLSDQKLYVYKDGSQVLETDIISGSPTPDLQTKQGVYAVSAKTSEATLDSVTVEGYEEPVKGWIAFNGRIGILDAPWRTTFGGATYQTQGTQGSIYVPEDSIQTIFDNVQEGTAVVVY